MVFTRISFGLSLIFCASLDRVFDRLDIVAVLDLGHVPADRLEPLRHVLAKREIGRAVDRNLVVVVKIDQIVELQMPGERSRFVS